MTVPVSNMTVTWNSGGTTFTSVKMNVTDTASAAGSLLMDLQVGSASKFTLDKTGNQKLYRTFTSATNFEALQFTMDPGGNTGYGIGPSKGSGGGTLRDLFIFGNNITFFADDTFNNRVRIGVLDINLGGGVIAAIANSTFRTFQFQDSNGSLSGGFFNYGGQSRVSSQFDKTSDTTLASVPGLSVTLAAGRTYHFDAVLYTTSNVAGGVKVAIGGTATATSVIYQAETIDGTTLGANTRATTLGTAVGAVTAVTAAIIQISGTITVNAAGTLTVQFAQNASNGTASSVLVGSSFIVNDIP